MAKEQEAFPIKFTLQHPDGKTKIKYRMRYCTWLEDNSLLMSLQTPKGDINMREVWLARMQRDLEGMDEKRARTLPKWEFSSLISMWMTYNDTNPSRFLDASPAEAFHEL